VLKNLKQPDPARPRQKIARLFEGRAKRIGFMDRISIRRPGRRRKPPVNFGLGRRITPQQRCALQAGHKSRRPISLPTVKCLERPTDEVVS
jgi:hypothetical protein